MTSREIAKLAEERMVALIAAELYRLAAHEEATNLTAPEALRKVASDLVSQISKGESA